MVSPRLSGEAGAVSRGHPGEVSLRFFLFMVSVMNAQVGKFSSVTDRFLPCACELGEGWDNKTQMCHKKEKNGKNKQKTAAIPG